MEKDRPDTVSKFQYWNYLEDILDGIQEGVYITDSEANTIYINHSYELITGLLKTEMLGKNMRELVDSGAVSASGTLMVLDSGERVTMEQSFKTGKRAIITSAPVYADPVKREHILMVVTSVREITELYSVRKELLRLERQNRQYVSELRRLHSELTEHVEIVAEDSASVRLVQLASRISITDSPVLISGEPGVGKEKMARLIHNGSGRSDFLFLCISFAVIPEHDPVGYLFGYEDPEKGEYHMGILESADGGTVYLDEIADMPRAVRGRFLSLLRDGTCLLGDGTLRRLNLRIIAGSQYTLEELESRRLLEEEILDYFSLFPLQILPLRKRREDIVPLIEYFLRRYQKKTGEKKRFSRKCYEKLLEYSWPGNIREVHALVQRAAVVSAGEEILPADLMLPEDPSPALDPVSGGQGESRAVPSFGTWPGEDSWDGAEISLKDEVAKLEAAYMSSAFAKYRNIREAAEKLGMDSSTFVRKRQRYEKMGLMERDRKA